MCVIDRPKHCLDANPSEFDFERFLLYIFFLLHSMDQELNDRLLAFFERPTPIKVAYEPLLEIRGTETRYCLPKDVARKEKEKKREYDFFFKTTKRHNDICLENKLRNQDLKLVRGQ